jgi:hypothetical protein
MLNPLLIYNYKTMSNRSLHNSISFFHKRLIIIPLIILIAGVLSEAIAQAPAIGAAKRVVQVDNPASGTKGNFNITYEIRVQNTGDVTLEEIQITDELASLTNLGASFVQLVNTPVIIEQPVGQNHPINPGYDGSMNDGILIGTGALDEGELLIVQITVEVNSTLAQGELSNQAIASGIFGIDLVEDESDTGSDPNGTNPFEYGDTGGSDDPTLLPNCWQDCVLACNNLVHVSVNSMCEAEIAAEMILEGEDEICAQLGFYNVEVRDEKGLVIPMDEIDGSFIGRRLQVRVSEIICGNSCWGYIIIEDKAPPILECQTDTFRCNQDLDPYIVGFPVDVSNITPTNNPRKFIASNVDACGPVELWYNDSLVNLECTDTLLSSIIFRKWRAIDESGFQAVCYDTFYLERGTFADLTLPPHWDGSDQPTLNCSEKDIVWPTFPDGTPDTSYTGRPGGIFCGNIQFDFHDDTIQVCGSSFKVLRNWIILDWCNPSDKLFYTQRIKIEDLDPPIAVCPPIDTVSTFDYSCKARARISHPIVFEECGNWSYTVFHKPADGSGNPDPSGATNKNVTLGQDGHYYIDDLPIGRSWIVYYITDECGNTTECVTEIDVLDQIKPVPVCHKHTTVSLTSSGDAKVKAEVFDDGSHDNCGIDFFEVKRVKVSDCDSSGNHELVYGPYVEFCCADILNNPITVELRVHDLFGNTNQCKVQVQIQDKIPPFVECLPNITVSCEFDRSDLSVFGSIQIDELDREDIIINDPHNDEVSQPHFWGRDGLAGDNCFVTIEERVIDRLNNCGVGIIDRRFTIADPGGLSVVCNQRITVKDFEPLTLSDIVWPADVELFGCKNQIDPGQTGMPIINNQDDCNLVASNYEDDVFNFVEGACYKILRRWTVIDWCTYPNSGYWQHTQVIKIINSENPEFTSSCEDQTICIDGIACNKRVVLTASAIDDCTPQSELLYNYKIDLDNNGSFDINGRGSTINRFFTAGTHRIVWSVEDQCGNVTACDYLITLNDCKEPTPYCRSGLVTVLMPTTGTVTIWASDFNVNSEDNCTAQEDLRFSFSSDSTDTGRTFSCDDLEDGISDTFSVQIWVTDLSGNQDFCTTKVVIQDNQDVCPDTGTGTKAIIAGKVLRYDETELEEVEVNLFKDPNNLEAYQMTNIVGEYTFSNLEMYSNYQLKPVKNDHHSNGVSTKDLVMIHRHILGIETLPSPFQLIAADVNNSGSVTVRDLIEIRKLILGIYTEFPNNQSWRFISADYTFPDPINPWKYTEDRNYHDIKKNEMAADFLGVKIGDVNASAITNAKGGLEVRNAKFLDLNAKLQQGKGQGGSEQISFSFNEDIDLYGFQFTLEFDPALFEILHISSGSIILDDENINYSMTDKGIITISWSSVDPLMIEKREPVFWVNGRSKTTTNIAESLRITSSITKSEAYSKSKGDFTLRLNSILENAHSTEITLMQNSPNPLVDVTSISFKVPITGQAILSFYDVTGKLLYKREVLANAGWNNALIRAEELSNYGIIYYRLEQAGLSKTMKMVSIH